MTSDPLDERPASSSRADS